MMDFVTLKISPSWPEAKLSLPHYLLMAALAGEELIRLNSSAPWTVVADPDQTIKSHETIKKSNKLNNYLKKYILQNITNISWIWKKQNTANKTKQSEYLKKDNYE